MSAETSLAPTSPEKIPVLFFIRLVGILGIFLIFRPLHIVIALAIARNVQHMPARAVRICDIFSHTALRGAESHLILKEATHHVSHASSTSPAFLAATPPAITSIRHFFWVT